MPFIEPHVHMSSRTTDDYYSMGICGISACVEPSFWSGTDKSSVASFEDYWEHVTVRERARAESHGMRHYSMIGVNPREARSRIAPEAVAAMERFLERPGVVGVGEIGLDLIAKEEEEILKAQLKLAASRSLPAIVHSPHQNKRAGIERIIEILKETGAEPRNIVIDHNTEETMGLSLKSGCWAGLTVYYVTKLSAERAVEMIKRYGTERILVNGSADWGHSDPLAVPKVALLMRKEGFSPDEIRKVTFDNPREFLKNPPGLDMDR